MFHYKYALICLFRLKDGMVAAEQCSRYHVDGYSLVIRDVAEEDAGIYTILTGIQQYGLQQNLTTTLVVNGETCRYIFYYRTF